MFTYQMQTSTGDLTTLFGKLAAIANEIQPVERDGRNTFQKYDYVSAEQVKAVIRPKLAKYKIALIAGIAHVEHTSGTTAKGAASYHTRLVASFTLTCGDTGQWVTVHWAGEGQDTGDKATNKAGTAALKYWLINTFLLSTQEDVDADAEGYETVPMADKDTLKSIAKGYALLNPDSELSGKEAALQAIRDICGEDATPTQENANRTLSKLRRQAAKEAA